MVTHIDLLWHLGSAGKNTTDIYSSDAHKESKLFFQWPQMADKLCAIPALSEFHQPNIWVQKYRYSHEYLPRHFKQENVFRIINY